MDIDKFTSRLIAHRGVHYKYIENTMDAFKSAVMRNYIIELDVRLTKDNVIVVFHDSNTYRLTGVNKVISESTYKELKDIIDIPTINEVLDYVKGRVPIIIEIKDSSKNRKLESMLARILDNYKYSFAIQSFNPLSIMWFKKNRPNFLRGYLINSSYSNNFLVNYILKSRLLSILLKPQYLGVNLGFLKSKKVIKLREKYLIFGYTINSQKQFNKYYEYADNLICNIGKEPYIKGSR